ncbi:protein tyrosine phosphatase receptor type C-associated protein [Phalacrocorax carbo]|uniref:protein tyrosine phosphatase receptor type C-associated protein n=1 Tax=Phalacrocorax carbo TaxID=9209 RepID=UPI0031196F67
MAGARWPLPVSVLVALAGLAAAGEPEGSHSDRVVGALLGVLLCLVVGLAVAWHHLCQLSAGRYHPLPMGHRVLVLLRGRWRQLRGHQHSCPIDGEVAAAAPLDEEKELMPWSQDQRPEDDEEEEKDEDDEPEEEREDEEAGASPPGEEQVAGGSAEALLSDLHAFSGTAAWGDAKPHITAL